MNIFWSLVLGAVQGLTEFLPVSSSGHLVLVQQLVPSFNQPGVLYDVVLHMGTLLAVVIVYWKKIIKIDLKFVKLLIIGTLPAVFVGLIFQDIVESAFSSLVVVGLALLVTGILNIKVDRFTPNKKTITPRNSLLVGLAQGVAIIPGISRSGSTIFAGVKAGITREKAVEFSFILSIPAVMGAGVLQIIKHGFVSVINLPFYFSGFVSAMLFGILAIKLVLKLLKSNKFSFFGYYCITVGIITLLTQ